MITKARAAQPEGMATIQPYWVAIIVAIISAIQMIGVAFLNTRTEKHIEVGTASTKESVDHLERQINSNMTRQINQAISEAIARERLRVEKKKPR